MPFSLSSTSFEIYNRFLSALSGNSVFVPGSFDHLETINVGAGGASSVTFSNLNNYASTYQHLQLRLVCLHSADQNAVMRFNGDTASNYNWHQIVGNGSSVASFGTSDSWMQIGYGPNSTTIPTASVIDILDPFDTSKLKTSKVLAGSASSTNNIKLMSGLWRSSAAISSITLFEINGAFKEGSRLSIYGMRAA